eukprot:6177369-Pleurochrysis_carterae.AAC.4
MHLSRSANLADACFYGASTSADACYTQQLDRCMFDDAGSSADACFTTRGTQLKHDRRVGSHLGGEVEVEARETAWNEREPIAAGVALRVAPGLDVHDLARARMHV